jgi:hypothetical protein
MKKLLLALTLTATIGLCGCQSYSGGAESPQDTLYGSGSGTADTNTLNTTGHAPGVNPWQGTPAQWRGSQPIPP